MLLVFFSLNNKITKKKLLTQIKKNVIIRSKLYKFKSLARSCKIALFFIDLDCLKNEFNIALDKFVD